MTQVSGEPIYVEASLNNGRTILLLASSQGERDDDVSRPTDVAFSQLRFSDLVETIVEIGSLLRSGFERIQPDEATVEISLAVNAKTGKIAALFADTGIDSALKLTLKWRSE